jgi:AraC-like DNA-binding protein
MLRRKQEQARGIVHGGHEPRSGGRHERYLPSAELSRFVEHHWFVEWNLSARTNVEVLPHPCVHVIFEAGRCAVSGVPLARFSRALEGRGRVLGTKFLPGGFHPFIARDVATLTDRILPLNRVFGDGVGELERSVLRAVDRGQLADAVAAIDRFLLTWPKSPSPSLGLVVQIARRMVSDPAMTRVERAADAFNMSPRALQRLFRAYVGVTPKWVIQRYRLHEAAERIAAGSVANWAGLAIELGYADQAHFIRDFRRAIGATPAAYLARVAGAPPPAKHQGEST